MPQDQKRGIPQMASEGEPVPERFATTFARIDSRPGMSAATGQYVALRLSPSSHSHLYAAKRIGDGLPVLLLEVSTGAIPRNQRLPHCAGFVVDSEVVVPGRDGRVRLVLAPSDDRYVAVFM